MLPLDNGRVHSLCVKVTLLGTHHLISGEGGGRVFVACKLFILPPRENTLLCFPYYVRYQLVFFLVNIFFINFDNKLFFSAYIFNKLFFLTFVATNYLSQFFSSPPPPRYQMVRLLDNILPRLLVGLYSNHL